MSSKRKANVHIRKSVMGWVDLEKAFGKINMKEEMKLKLQV